jgi:hypothetical protein
MMYGNQALWNVGSPGAWELIDDGIQIDELECCPP